MNKHQQTIMTLYSSALAAVEGQQAVQRYLPTLSLAKNTPINAIAIGKAAEAMLQGLLNTKTLTVDDALLISKHGHISQTSYQNPIIQCIEADHPVPNTASLQAGEALLNYITRLPETHTCIVLLSGGTSSLVEVLTPHWQLTELQELTQWMLTHAMSIDAINGVRSRVSCIKSGGLWRYFASPTQKVVCLLISDVPSNDEHIIGSGLLFPVSNTEIPAALPESLPVKWRDKLTLQHAPPSPSCFFTSTIIANNQQAQQAAMKKAQQLGYQVICDNNILEGDAVMIAQHCVQTLAESRGIIFIWGAETTVNLPTIVGKGGRNQHVALAAAIEIAKTKGGNIMLLAAGTDGTDGTTEAAGGFVDQQTVLHGEHNGHCAMTALKNADANSFLRASGDLVTTGVTGTNVMDLIIGYAVI